MNTSSTTPPQGNFLSLSQIYFHHRYLLVSPLFWMGHHMQQVGCNFLPLRECTNPTLNLAYLAVQRLQRRQKEKNDVWTLSISTDVKLKLNILDRLLITNGLCFSNRELSTKLYFNGKKADAPSFSVFRRYSSPIETYNTYNMQSMFIRAPSLVGYLDYTSIIDRRLAAFPCRPAPCGGRNLVVEAWRSKRVRKVTPPNWSKDPYLVAVLLALAQNQEKDLRALGHQQPLDTYTGRLMVTYHNDWCHLYVYDAVVSRQLLRALENPKTATQHISWPAIQVRKVSYEPFETFNERLTGVLIADAVDIDPANMPILTSPTTPTRLLPTRPTRPLRTPLSTITTANTTTTNPAPAAQPITRAHRGVKRAREEETSDDDIEAYIFGDEDSSLQGLSDEAIAARVKRLRSRIFFHPGNEMKGWPLQEAMSAGFTAPIIAEDTEEDTEPFTSGGEEADADAADSFDFDAASADELSDGAFDTPSAHPSDIPSEDSSRSSADDTSGDEKIYDSIETDFLKEEPAEAEAADDFDFDGASADNLSAVAFNAPSEHPSDIPSDDSSPHSSDDTTGDEKICISIEKVFLKEEPASPRLPSRRVSGWTVVNPPSTEPAQELDSESQQDASASDANNPAQSCKDETSDDSGDSNDSDLFVSDDDYSSPDDDDEDSYADDEYSEHDDDSSDEDFSDEDPSNNEDSSRPVPTNSSVPKLSMAYWTRLYNGDGNKRKRERDDYDLASSPAKRHCARPGFLFRSGPRRKRDWDGEGENDRLVKKLCAPARST
ncbi:hypothetical protein BJX70DRAFT_396150 [Aspergillus crustosus]